MTEQAGFTEQPASATDADSDGQPGTGPVAEDTPGPEPSTEAPGAAAAEDAEPAAATEPEQLQEPAWASGLPPVDADPQQVAEEVAAAMPAEAGEAISSTAGAPDPMPGPFIPSEGVAPWLREALVWLHDRIRNLEG